MSACTIKICGVTREEDVDLVGDAGADYLGLLIDMPSPRTLTAERAAELMARSKAPVVLLFFDKPREELARIVNELTPHAVQLQGHESADDVKWLCREIDTEIWKGVHLPARGGGGVQVQEVIDTMNGYTMAGADKILLDTVVKTAQGEQRGGTGKTFDWDAAAEIVLLCGMRVILAGGLNPDNVADAITRIHPYGVDLSSGVEKSPGVKDPDKVRAFVKAVRGASDSFFL